MEGKHKEGCNVKRIYVRLKSRNRVDNQAVGGLLLGCKEKATRSGGLAPTSLFHKKIAGSLEPSGDFFWLLWIWISVKTIWTTPTARPTTPTTIEIIVKVSKFLPPPYQDSAGAKPTAPFGWPSLFYSIPVRFFIPGPTLRLP